MLFTKIIAAAILSFTAVMAAPIEAIEEGGPSPATVYNERATL
jgi:hypothetical protein